MKNKSKLKKIREKKAGTATVTKEWLYMNPNSITVAEIENALEGMDGIETEIWRRGGSIRGGGSGASFHGYRGDCSQFKG